MIADPITKDLGPTRSKCERGASYVSEETIVRSYWRAHPQPFISTKFLGFRVALGILRTIKEKK